MIQPSVPPQDPSSLLSSGQGLPSVRALFLTFFKIGLFTIGGGYAMLALVKKNIVDEKQWMNEEDFVESIAVIQSMPGIFAVNMALTVGTRVKGKKGSLAAAWGAVLPSLIIVLALTIFARSARDLPAVEACFKGIRPCVVALILSPAIQMVKKSGINWKNAFIPILATLLVCFLSVNPVIVILAAAFGGALYGFHIQKRRLP